MLLNLKNVKVSQKETNELHKRMSNWDKFHADVVKNEPTAEEFEKMLKVEVETRGRGRFALRLLGMYQNAARKENELHVMTLLRG